MLVVVCCCTFSISYLDSMLDTTSTLAVAYVADKIIVPFANKLLGGYADDLKALFDSRAKKLFSKSEEMLADTNIEPQPVELKVLKPLIEGAILEENESLVDKWAALLANAASSAAGKDLVEPSFADVLKQLTPPQARLLDLLYKQVTAEQMQREHSRYHAFQLDPVRKALELPFADFERCMDNLIRLRLCTRIVPARNINFLKPDRSFPTTEPTMFGYAFVTACTPPTKQ